MKRWLSLLLVAACLLNLTGCSIGGKKKGNTYREDENLGQYVHTENSWQGALTAREQNILTQMELVLENEYLSLYLGQYHDIAVLDKAHNSVFFSGDAMYNAEGTLKASNAVLKHVATQVQAEYFNENNTSYTKASYPDSYLHESFDQVKVEKGEDYVRVTYNLGFKNEQLVLPPAIANETYRELVKRLNALVKEDAVAQSDVRIFTSNTVYQKLTYIESSEAMQQYVRAYHNLPEIGSINTLKSELSDKEKLSIHACCVALGLDEAFVAEQKKLLGYDEVIAAEEFYLPDSVYFNIPLIYRLDGGDLIAAIETDKITHSENVHLLTISLLPTFGAVAAEEGAGYLFIPDGGGTVIGSDTNVYGVSQLTVPFYGHDFGTTYENYNTLSAYSSFPVWGIKQGEKALFANVISGDAVGGVVGRSGMSLLPYACAFPYMNYRIRDYLNRDSNVHDYSKVLPAQDFAVRYHFLYGEDAGYSGMARYYRSYLTAQGTLRDMQADAMHLQLRLIGAINKIEKMMGLPVKQVVAATTFEEAADILAELHEKGVGAVDVIYTEIMNGAKEYKSPSKINIESVLGDESGYNALVAQAEQVGDTIYPSVDLGKVYKQGNGVRGVSDVVGLISGDTAMFYDGIEIPSDAIVPSLVNPGRYAALTASMLQSYRSNLQGESVHLPTLGYFLAGNYNERYELPRTESKNLTAQALDMIGQELNVKLEGANVYALPYADSLLYAELDSSHNRLETHAVPFVAMVLKGSIPFAGTPLNNSGDYTHAFLKMIENGASPYFEIMAADTDILTDTDYLDMYAASKAQWMEQIAEMWNELDENGYLALAGVPIYAHEMLAENVFVTRYENGARVLVNYSKQPYEYEGVLVSPSDYAVLDAKE